MVCKEIYSNGLKVTFLTKKHYIEVEGIKTSNLNIKCGVPQASTLGPLLFLIYVNDLHKRSVVLETIMFPDDTNLFFLIKSRNYFTRLILN